MKFELLQHVIGTIIKTIQTTALQVVQELQKSTYKVHVDNPQTKVEVTGKVEVDQKLTNNKLGGVILAINSLKKALKPYKEVKVSNMVEIPSFPVFPEFPKEIKVSNMTNEIDVNAIVDAMGKVQKAISNLKLDPTIKVGAPTVNVPAPVVNVPIQKAPVVNVEAPDLSDITKIIEFFNSLSVKKPLPVRLSNGNKFYEALQEMADIYAGSTFSAFQDPTGGEGRGVLNRNNELQVTTSDTWIANYVNSLDANTTYIGQETVDGRWRFEKVVKSGNINIITYATSKNNPTINSYTLAETNFNTLTYNRVSLAF